MQMKLIYSVNVNFDNAYLDEERDVMSLLAHCLLMLYAALLFTARFVFATILSAGICAINM